MISSTVDLAIVGAGPVGLDAAVRASRNDMDFVVLEKESVGNNVRQYTGVELFTPFEMNRSEAELEFAEERGIEPPDSSAYLTAEQFVGAWLEPLVDETELRESVRTGTEVRSITREGLLKSERIGGQDRAGVPFRIVLEGEDPSVIRAESVIDASGTFGRANPLGTGGIRAPGENDFSDRIERRFPDREELGEWVDRSVLLVGSGYSAATNLMRLVNEGSEATLDITWLLRSEQGPPVERVEDDPLEKRDELGQKVNRLAREDYVTLRRGVEVHALYEGESGVDVELTDGSRLEVDRILANVGYRPDRSLYRELQFHECYATEGPIDLAGSLLEQDGADCLDVDPGGVDTLLTPEPGFYVLGAKSYGRNSNFLLETGFEQVRGLFEHREGRGGF